MILYDDLFFIEMSKDVHETIYFYIILILYL